MFPGEETPPSGDAATIVLASSVMRRNEDYARAIIQVFGEHPGSVGRMWEPGRGNCSGTAVATSQARGPMRSEQHTSELQSLMRISYAVFCLTKHTKKTLKTY